MKAKKIAILKEEYIKGDMQQSGLECYCSDLGCRIVPRRGGRHDAPHR